MIKILLAILIYCTLYATQNLESKYFVSTSDIKLSDITHNQKDTQLLFTITDGRYSKKVKRSQLLHILQKYGYNDYTSHHAYIKFEKKSPIDTKKIQKFIEDYYKHHYKYIEISNIEVDPRGYIKELPSPYTIKMQKRSYLHKHGTLSIKGSNKRQLFFDYTITAKVMVYISKKEINRNEELSFVNTLKKSIILEKFRALPIQEIQRGTIESKIHISKGKILTLRDVESLHLIKRGATVNVTLQSGGISISFSAKAVRNGKLGDIITIENSDGKRIKVQVIGKNRARVL